MTCFIKSSTHSLITDLSKTVSKNLTPNRLFPPYPPPPTSTSPSTSNSPPTKHVIYYRNQFSDNYKLDERIMKYIIKNNVKCCHPKDSIQFPPYYRSNKITNLIIKSNLTPPTNNLKKNSFTNFLAMKETVNSITKHT